MALETIEISGWKSLEAAIVEGKQQLEAHGYQGVELVEDSVVAPEGTSDRWTLGFRVADPPSNL